MQNLQQLKPNLIKCELCRDTGWRLNEEYNTYFECDCVARNKRKHIWETSGISLDDMNKNFKEFEAWTNSVQEMKIVAMEYYKTLML